ncbi:MAG: DUF393 domain-containing protein [Flavobacteriales bacterium]|nr:DUF393 domain-containing protein [Flavobacteriales bacterium]
MSAMEPAEEKDPLGTELPDQLLLFDGVCNLCNGLVRFIIRHDKHQRFRFAPLQGRAGKRVLQHHGLNSGAYDTLVYLRNGAALTRSTAALNVARDLGGAWRMAYVLIWIPRWIRDAVYDLVSRRRFRWFGKREACMVPDPGLRSRFLM